MLADVSSIHSTLSNLCVLYSFAKAVISFVVRLSKPRKCTFSGARAVASGSSGGFELALCCVASCCLRLEIWPSCCGQNYSQTVFKVTVPLAPARGRSPPPPSRYLYPYPHPSLRLSDCRLLKDGGCSMKGILKHCAFAKYVLGMVANKK